MHAKKTTYCDTQVKDPVVHVREAGHYTGEEKMLCGLCYVAVLAKKNGRQS